MKWNFLKYYLESLKLKRILLGSTLSILGILFLLKIVFPLFTQPFFSKTGFQADNYYTLVAISLICLVPFIIGILSAYGLTNTPPSDLLAEKIVRIKFLITRMFFAVIICFVLIMLVVLLTNPVPAEGWLRTLFSASIISIQTSFFCLLYITAADLKAGRFPGFVICSLFLITVPFGLLVHHPWNYFEFFSPLYWVAWTWIIRSPAESIEYGIIAVTLTIVMQIILTRHFLRKNTGR